MKTKTSNIPYAIEVKNLVKVFGRREVLKGINLSLYPGEFLGIFGPNGAGKTTLLRILATLLKPTSGEIIIDGEPVEDETISARKKIGLISHATFLYPDLSAYENLRFYGKMFGVLNLSKRIDELLGLVELEARKYDLVRSFSRGMQQRLAIARALLHGPSLLLLDEPYNGLDARATEILDGVLKKLREKRCTFILTTHDLKKGFELVSSLAILSKGKICFSKRKEEIEEEEFIRIYEAYGR